MFFHSLQNLDLSRHYHTLCIALQHNYLVATTIHTPVFVPPLSHFGGVWGFQAPLVATTSQAKKKLWFGNIFIH
jgi:hypothetical protein